VILRFFGSRGGGLRSPSVAGLMGRNSEEDEAGPGVDACSSPVEEGAADIYFLMAKRRTNYVTGITIRDCGRVKRISKTEVASVTSRLS